MNLLVGGLEHGDVQVCFQGVSDELAHLQFLLENRMACLDDLWL